MKKQPAIPNFPKLEEQILEFWNKQDVFKKLKAKNKGSKKYYSFLDGPITANNSMGLHHAWNRSLKDAMLKFAAMTGHDAHYQNGFDSHGLPVEIKVEKELGLNSKRDIEEFGMANFIEECMGAVNKYAGLITEQSKRLGQWMDWDNSYFTNSDENITSIWHFLKICRENNWLVQKYRPTPWCARCGTSLSEHEMNDADAYKEVEHTAVFVKLPVQNTNWSILVWTTTPWTLAANVAVAVHPELEYSVCRIKSDDRLIVVGSEALKVLKNDLIKVEKVVKGSDLVGLVYETCFEELEEQKFDHKIVEWEEVSATEGTGMVHIAPGCGQEDFDLGQSISLPNIIPIDEAGNFFNTFGCLSGINAEKVADVVFDELKERGKLYYTHKYRHRYPHCWRCKSQIVYRLVKDWSIKMDEIRPKLIQSIEKVEFQPEFMRKRMLDWLVNMGDWSISRKRYYGVPLPFYICPDCGEFTVVGSLEEFKKLSSAKEVEALPHLHRPYIDAIKINCPKCGQKVERVPEVGDCWLDAGITPFSTKGYFSDKKAFEKNFPIEAVLEGREQIRLWFYSLLVMSVAMTGKAPYKKVIGTAMLLDKDGYKLSKSSPNNITIDEGFEKIGADIIRYMFAANNMLSDVRFSFETTDEIKRKLIGFWNVLTFFNTYAIIDNPKLAGFVPDKASLDITDKWLIEKTNKLIEDSKKNYETNKYHNIIKDFEEYADELSNWYIRVNRRRFWKSEDEADKLNAYFSLYYSIKSIAGILAPVLPFLSEYIWQNWVREVEPNAETSVFLAGYPSAWLKVKSEKLIQETEDVRTIISIAGRLRNENQLKIKQPLRTMFLNVEDKVFDAAKKFEDIIKDELNVKEIVFETDNNKFNNAYLMVNFKTAGAVLKCNVQQVKNILQSASDEQMKVFVSEFEKGSVDMPELGKLDSELFVLAYKPKEEYVIGSEEKITVVLDTTLDEKLMLEGMLREFVRSLQVLRKEADFKIEDRIIAEIVTDSDTIKTILEKFKDTIKKEVLIKNFETITQPSIEKTLEVSGEEVLVKMKNIN